MGDDFEKADIEYNSQLDAFELYHLIVEDEERPSQRNGGPVLPALGHAVSGSVATAASKLLIYPLDLVIARLQVQKQVRARSAASHDYKGLLDAVTKIYQHEGGLSAFYTGCAADVTKGIADSFLFFLAYTFLQQYELRRAQPGKKKLPVIKEIGIGILAGAFSKLITTPLQNIITRQQTAALLVARDAEADDGLRKGDSTSVRQIAAQIYRERGLSAFWTGYRLSVVLTLNPSITFAVDNFLRSVLRARDSGAHVTFLMAAVSKAIATAITYPISVAKSRAQAQSHGNAANDKKQSPSLPASQSNPLTRLGKILLVSSRVFSMLSEIYQKEGLSGLYSGLEAEVLKGFLSHGLTMMMKDRVHGSIIELYYLLLKVTRTWPTDLPALGDAATGLAADVEERVENIGVTVLEGGKEAVRELEKKLS